MLALARFVLEIMRLYGTGGGGYPELVVVVLLLLVADYGSTGDRTFLTGDPRMSYGLVFTPYTGELLPSSPAPQITPPEPRPHGSPAAISSEP